jgi:hypothetical protein
LNVGSGVTINGTLVMGSNVLSLSGAFVNAGTFTAGTSTVRFNGGDQSITGSNTFYDLVKAAQNASESSKTFTIQAGSTQTVTHALLLKGAGSTARLNLRSSSPGH